MKTLKCYDCEESFQAETTMEMLNHFYGHYMKEHGDIIKGASEEEKAKWMEKFNKDWNDN